MRPLWVTAVVFACLGAAAVPSAALAQKWGNVKGQITLEGAIPAPDEIEFKPDQCPCQKKGEKLYKETWVVNKDTKGIKNVVVWLSAQPDLRDPPVALPVHPDLAKAKLAPDVVLDQPCCAFEPHVQAMRKGQTLVIKNSASFAHNSHYSGKDKNGNLEDNPLIQPGGEVKVQGLVPYLYPVNVECNLHGWMKAKIYVFDHPYYAVTDKDGKFDIPKAPAGDYYLVVWHEEAGWHDMVETPIPDSKKTNRVYGKKITIKEDGDTEVNLTYKAPEKKKD